MKAILLLLCLTVLNTSAQNDKIYYSASAIYTRYFSKDDTKLLSTVPRGKGVELSYDTFFKIWIIRYIDENGIKQPMKFTFLQKDEYNRDRMIDPYNNTYVFFNNINIDKTLFISVEKPLEDGKTIALEITGIELKQ